MARSAQELDRDIEAYLAKGGARGERARSRSAGAREGAYHPLGREGDPWPRWLVDLSEAPGAYVIRDAATRRALYAGSAKNNLYSTITRHFQQWRRRKKWWKGQYGAGHDPGLVYDRGRCEVAVWITPEEQRLDKEAQLILRLHPRDNLVEHPEGELEEAPF